MTALILLPAPDPPMETLPFLPPSVVTSGEPAMDSRCMVGAWCIGVNTGGVWAEEERGEGGALGEGADMVGRWVMLLRMSLWPG